MKIMCSINQEMILISLFFLWNVGVSTSQRNNVTNIELKELSNQLFRSISLPKNFSNQIFLNYQGQISNNGSEDMAPKIFINVTLNNLESVQTIKLMRRLYNNFELDVNKKESKTFEEGAEEDDFVSALLDTKVMRHAMEFLVNKGYIDSEVQKHKSILKLLWFHLYPRKRNMNAGSSGFEHVFLIERKGKNKLIGLHNWVYFAEEELNERLNYLGYIRRIQLSDKVSLAFIKFTFDGIQKKSSLFIGTPPELEIALYTICFFVKPGKSCRFGINNNTFLIQTYIKKSEGHNLIATAYPQI